MSVYPAENGYAIKGIAPPDLRGRDEATKLLYWSWVVELGLRAKDKELSQGLGANGKPLRRITEATRKHRRSAMTPSGKGDPSAPPLMPARALSRTRSLLSGRAYPDRAEFWWRFDPFTGRSWADTLEVQRDRWGRDVFGVSPKAQKLIQARSYELWDRWKRGLPVAAVRGAIVPMAPAVQRPPPPKEEVGNEAWRRLFAEPAKAAQPGRPGAPGTVLLRHIFGTEGPSKTATGAVKVTPPKASPPKMTRVAMAPPAPPRPKPRPTPPPTPPPPPPTSAYPILPDRPIAERLVAWTEGDRMVKAVAAIEAHKVSRYKVQDMREEIEKLLKARKPTKAAQERIAHLQGAVADAEQWQDFPEKARETILSILKPDHPIGGGIKLRPGAHVTRELEQAVSKGSRFVFGALNDPTGKAGAVYVEVEAHPSGFRASAGMDLVSVAKTDRPRTVAHEIGHCLEDQIPGVKKVEKEFLAHRAPGEKSRKLNEVFPDSKYEDWEEGVEDEFGKYFSTTGSGAKFGDSSARYAGKHYSNRSEILSMGIEALYEDGPWFAHKDPEYCKLILGLLTGALR